MAIFVKNAILFVFCIYLVNIAAATSCPPSKCPKNGNAVVAVLEDSGKYMKCTNGIGIVSNCPEGEYFRFEDKSCSTSNNPGPLSCDSEEDSSEEVEERSFNTNTFEVANNISQRCLNNSVTVFICPDELPEDNLFPHPDDTHLFYYCVEPGQRPICRECPGNLEFDPDLKVCNFNSSNYENLHQLVGPTNGKRNESSVEGSPCEEKNGEYADLRPNPYDCNKYYVCDWGRLIPMHCPEGMHFNALLKVCDSPSKANCNNLENVK